MWFAQKGNLNPLAHIELDTSHRQPFVPVTVFKSTSSYRARQPMCQSSCTTTTFKSTSSYRARLLFLRSHDFEHNI